MVTVPRGCQAAVRGLIAAPRRDTAMRTGAETSTRGGPPQGAP
jgi:hypothetical protein